MGFKGSEVQIFSPRPTLSKNNRELATCRFPVFLSNIVLCGLCVATHVNSILLRRQHQTLASAHAISYVNLKVQQPAKYIFILGRLNPLSLSYPSPRYIRSVFVLFLKYRLCAQQLFPPEQFGNAHNSFFFQARLLRQMSYENHHQ